jgi:hypothetical protein
LSWTRCKATTCCGSRCCQASGRPYTGNDLRDYVIGLVERTAVAHEEAPDGIHPHIVPLGVLAALQMLDNAMPVAQEDQ